jgi:hypothetical protein
MYTEDEEYTGPLVSGYNARLGKRYDFVGSIMGKNSKDSSRTWPIDRWPDEASYNKVFDYLRTPPVDPELLVISGTIAKDGTVIMGPSYELPNGLLSSEEPEGDVLIKIVNSQNLEVYSHRISFNSNVRIARARGEPGVTSFDLGVMPFAVALPKLENASSVQIVRSGRILSTTRLAATKLEGIINSLPLDSFVSSRLKNGAKISSIKKQVLLAQALKIQEVIAAGKNQAAAVLVKALIIEVSAFTLNNYVASNNSELAPKDAIIALKKIQIELESSNKGRK